MDFINKVKRFIPKSERITKEKFDAARQQVFDLDLPQRATEDIIITLQRHETGGVIADWNFNMISPKQCLEVWQAIKTVEKPHETRDVFDFVLTHIETNSGIVTLTREELAEKVGIAPREVSRAMGRLEKLGVIFRERWKTAGMRGPGIARYRLNPHVGWNGSLENRKLKALEDQEPTLLTLMDGGKSN